MGTRQTTQRRTIREQAGNSQEQVPMIGIPGNSQENVGIGDHRRIVRLDGSDFLGAWTDDTRYFARHVETGVLECQHVWWLHVVGNCENVPEGDWEATLRVKCDRATPGAEWKVSVDQSGQEVDQILVFHSLAGRPFVPGYRAGEWVRLSFGVIRLTRPGIVRFSVFGTEHLIRGIHFGDLELRACGIKWEKERLLLLCLLHKANDTVGECQLQDLPEGAIGLIAQMLITPDPAEINQPGSLLRRPSDALLH